MKKIASVVGMALVVVYFCYKCGVFNPPISISLRESLISGYVLQVSSLSNKPIECLMSVYNHSQGQKRENVQFVIPSGETKELGLLELNWKFEPGEHGWVSVSGHPMKLNFKLENNGRYRVWPWLMGVEREW